jgi:hypothetical protein
MKTRSYYLVQIAGSELWLEVKKRALDELRAFHGKHRVKVDRRAHQENGIKIVENYISIEE